MKSLYETNKRFFYLNIPYKKSTVDNFPSNIFYHKDVAVICLKQFEINL